MSMPLLKRIARLRHPDIVHVWWLDSSAMHGWRTMEEAKKTDTLRIASIGIVVDASESTLIITTSVGDNADVMDPLTIPCCAIQGIRKIGRVDLKDLRRLV